MDHPLLRNTHYKTIWTAYATIWFGVWLLVAPAAFGISGPLVWSDSISGALLILFGWASISYRKVWAPWAVACVGVWLGFAPLVFWTHSPVSYFNDTLVGALLIGLSILIPALPGRLPDTGPSVPPGWSYNPSSWPQRLPIVLLGTIGWFISRYLAARQLGFINSVWDPVFGDGTLRVITSSVSEQFPVSDAGLGALAYTLEVLFALKGDERRWRTMPWMVVLFGLLVVPLGLVSITLIILQPLVVGAWCFLCLCTAFCMAAMVALALDEVAAVCQFLRQMRKKRVPFWPLFWKGGECPGAHEDHRTPPLDAPLLSILKASCWGVSLIWNLLLSLLLGALLMLAPWIYALAGGIADADHLLGACAMVASIVSLAEVARKARIFNLLFGIVLLGLLFLFGAGLTASSLAFHIVTGVALIVLSIRKGPLFETGN